jgi:hypothetical protein
MRKLNWREMIGAKVVYGSISDANRAIFQDLLMLPQKKRILNTVQELEISFVFRLILLESEIILNTGDTNASPLKAFWFFFRKVQLLRQF